MFSEIYKMIISLIIIIVKWLIYALIPFAVMCGVFFLYYTIRGKRIPKRDDPSTWTDRNLLLKLFWDFPKRFIQDRFETNPDEFPENLTGLFLFAGEQGSGKTSGAVYYMHMLKQKYPKCHLMSNIDLKFADEHFEDMESIILNDNGTDGTVVFVDEIQNTFNSTESRNFPPEMITEICQQRKQRKTIVATSQVFARVAKPIREQVFMLVKPLTILGCFTILRFYKPNVKQDGTIEKLRRVKTMCFVHTQEIRDAFDTREKVLRLARKGFKPLDERLGYEKDSVNL